MDILNAKRVLSYMENGKRDAAFCELRLEVAANPACAWAWYSLGEVGGYDCGGRDIDAMEHLRTSSELTAHDRILLDFALGKAYLQIKSYDAAMAAFHAGNRRKRESLRFSVGFDERRVQNLIRTFSRDMIRKPHYTANLSDRPIFIVGMPRSGTTLVEQILCTHSEIFGAGELPLLGQMASTVVEHADDVSVGDRYVAELSRLAHDERYITDKLPLNFFNIGFIRQNLPNARIIHCVRDSVETGLSCFMTLFDMGHEFSYSFEDIGRFSLAYQRLMNYWRPALDPKTFIEIEYESLVSDVEAEARRLLKFCDLRWEDSVLRFDQNPRSVQTASKVQVRRPIYRDSLDRAAKFGPTIDPLRKALRLTQSVGENIENVTDIRRICSEQVASAIDITKAELLVDITGICAIVVIGSTATGRRLPTSDIDMLVLTVAPFNQFMHIVRGGYEVDIQVYSLLYLSRAFLENSDYMHHSIRVGKCIWEENLSWTALKSQAPLMRAPRGSIDELDPKARAFYQRAPLRLLEVYRQSIYNNSSARQIALDGIFHELLTACYRMRNRYPPKAPNRVAEFVIDFPEWSHHAESYLNAEACDLRLRVLEDLADAMVTKAGGALKEYIGPLVSVC